MTGEHEKKFKVWSIFTILLILLQLQSCSDEDDDYAIELACKFNNPVFCNDRGYLKYVNNSTSRHIIRIYLVEGCSNGWGNGMSVNVSPQSSVRFRLDSGDKYDVKADWEDNTCDTKLDQEVPYGTEKEQILTRDPLFCNINATSC